MTNLATRLRLLLERRGAYPAIEAVSAAGEFPVKLFPHIGVVYHRLETVAGADFEAIAPLRLAVLVHEEPPDALGGILDAAGLSELAPTVFAVVGEFGKLWKIAADDEIAEYVDSHRAHLASLLLFELAHEGSATRAMERAAQLGGLAFRFEGWRARLSSMTS